MLFSLFLTVLYNNVRVYFCALCTCIFLSLYCIIMLEVEKGPL
nr:MAG TPA: hypothetical protein [Bacteriophage sp.]